MSAATIEQITPVRRPTTEPALRVVQTPTTEPALRPVQTPTTEPALRPVLAPAVEQTADPDAEQTFVRLGEPPRRLRRLPLPACEPRAAHRIPMTTEPTGPQVAATQEVLPLGLVMPQHDIPPQRNDPDDLEDLPDPAVWVGQFVVAAVEVAAGVRAAGQLLKWTTMDVQGVLARRGALTTQLERGRASNGRRPVVRAVRVCPVRQGVCEASAVVADRGRVRAVALRIEAQDGRWRATVLELGR